MKKSYFTTVYITTKNKKEAQKIATVLLKKRLIACANIIDNIKSLYWWQEKIENSKESILLGKTTNKFCKKIINTVKKHHSYDCPAIVFYKCSNGSKDFFNWISKELKVL